jgi:hypothetical protein
MASLATVMRVGASREGVVLRRARLAPRRAASSGARLVVRADLYKCGKCSNEFNVARVGKGLKYERA